MPEAAALTLAAKTPLTRAAIADLAKKTPAAVARKLAPTALDAAGAHAASVLAFVLVAHGETLDPAFARALLPELDAIEHFGPLAFATGAGVVDLLTGFVEDARGTWEREALALLLVAEELGGESPPPPLVTRARFLARHQLSSDAGILLGAAAARLGDRTLSSLAAPHVNRARRAKRAVEEWIGKARRPPLDALDDAAGARISAGFTVRRESPAVGRNDPCPCGSGKKYKKCHALEPSVALDPPPKIDSSTLGPEQAATLRPSMIAALDRARLSRRAWVEAFRRVVDFRRWDLAATMIEEAKERSDLADDAPMLALDALRGAGAARSVEAAERFHAMLPVEVAGREALELDFLRAERDLLARVEHEATEALHEDADGARGVLLASVLLRHAPALGIYVARGALHEGRLSDSEVLLEQIEDARDRLLLPPFEPWWDVYDGLFADAEDRREQRKSQEEKDKHDKLKENLRRARAESRKASNEIAKLQRRVEELDALPGAAPPSRPTKQAEPAQPAPDGLSGELSEERRRLKTKIDELQRIIGEGQEERRELRRRLATSEPADPPARGDAAPKAAREPTNDDADPEDMHDDEGVDVPRAILVPRFSERAAKILGDLEVGPAETVLTVVAALAAGRPNAWGGVKQLTKVRGVFSARAGIHHRVLFRVDEGALDVVEVLHRRELEQVVARLARAS